MIRRGRIALGLTDLTYSSRLTATCWAVREGGDGSQPLCGPLPVNPYPLCP